MPRTLQTNHSGSDGCACHIINVITGGMVGIQCWGRGFITYAHTAHTIVGITMHSWSCVSLVTSKSLLLPTMRPITNSTHTSSSALLGKMTKSPSTVAELHSSVQ